MSNTNYAFEAEERNGTGKGIARAIRREQKVPAVIYGDHKEPVTITLPAKELALEYRKGQMFTTLCDLSVGKDKHLVLARDIQLHPVTDLVMHIDFLRVTKKTMIAVNVPVNFINEEASPGIEAKGVLNVVRHTVELRCSAVAIPEQIDVDLTGKDLGASINVSDAALPEGTKPVIDDRDFTIATLLAPRLAEEEPTEGEEGEATEGEAAAEGVAPAEAAGE